MAKVEINQDGQEVNVTSDHELLVAVSGAPVLTPQKTKPFRQFFTLDGTPEGDHDMGQDGSVSELDFFIPADPEDDLYITHVSIAMGYGASGRPYQFGDGAALVDGVRFFYKGRNEEIDIHDAIKSNQNLFRLSSAHYQAAWELRGIGDMNDYGYFVTIPLTHFSSNFGIKLDAGTTQKIAFTVRDAMVAVSALTDTFDAVAHGFKRFK